MTVSSPDRLFDAAVASEVTSSVIDTNTHPGIKVFRVAASSSFAGTLTVQGQQNGDGDTWQRVRYWTLRPPATAPSGPSQDVLTLTALDSYLLVYVMDPWPAMRLQATRTSGSLTVDFYNEMNPAFAVMLLASSMGVYLTDPATGAQLSLGDGGTLGVTSSDFDQFSANVRLWNEDGPIEEDNALPIEGEVKQGDPGSREWPVIAGSRTVTLEPDNQPVVSTSPAYTGGDVVGTLMMFNLERAGHNGGVLETLVITDLSAQSAQIDVFFFAAPLNQSLAVETDNAAFAPAIQDMTPPVYRGAVSIAAADYVGAGSGKSTATKNGLGMGIGLPPDHRLWALMVTRGTPTYTVVNALRVTLGVLLD